MRSGVRGAAGGVIGFQRLTAAVVRCVSIFTADVYVRGACQAIALASTAAVRHWFCTAHRRRPPVPLLWMASRLQATLQVGALAMLTVSWLWWWTG